MGRPLETDLYFPAIGGERAPGRFPVILERTPYNKLRLGARDAGYFFARRGYVGAVQDVRGALRLGRHLVSVRRRRHGHAGRGRGRLRRGGMARCPGVVRRRHRYDWRLVCRGYAERTRRTRSTASARHGDLGRATRLLRELDAPPWDGRAALFHLLVSDAAYERVGRCHAARRDRFLPGLPRAHPLVGAPAARRTVPRRHVALTALPQRRAVRLGPAVARR